ncbi:helix-turn-helix domain-containing protein [Paludifilum halophilum]|uniref:Helix-turn-helix domain-containing protein n=1 Tax=Paludifilum halophilum TaxID=1642702 RepID=A0A235B3T4_9BACL|nr:helix-turn-helix domain-containing protein [Paludifilum halophilum]OYD06295.1 hypothetical protein CHM34_17170 [Paludifilum halophilum]
MHPVYIEQMKAYQTFKSAKDVRAAIEAHLSRHILTENQLRVLRVLEFRSRTVPGVAMVKYSTIAEVVGVVRRTVIRAVNKLVALGIVEKYGRTREARGGDGANVFVIVPAQVPTDDPQADTQSEESGEPVPSDSEADISGPEEVEEVEEVKDSYKDKDIRYNVSGARSLQSVGKTVQERVQDEKEEDNKEKDTPLGEKLPKEFIPADVPESFVSTAWPFNRDAVKVANLYDRCKLAARSLGDNGVREELAVEAFRVSLFAMKSRKLRGDLAGYLYGTYRKLAEEEMAAEARRAYFEDNGIDLGAFFGVA